MARSAPPPLLLWLLAALLALPTEAQEAGYGRYAASRFSQRVALVDWNSSTGKARLARATGAGTAADFYQLAHHYQPQINALYCGIASAVIVLNALRAGRQAIPSQATQEVAVPAAYGGGRIPYPLYAQASFLNAATERVKPRSVVEFQAAAAGRPDPGLTLQELRGMLAAYGAQATAIHAAEPEDAGGAAFRAALQAVVGDEQRFMIVNYDSKAVGQAGGGHISPVAAYDAESDAALLLDVSGHLNPWLWVPVRDLYLAMRTRDGAAYRGYVVVAEGARKTE